MVAEGLGDPHRAGHGAGGAGVSVCESERPGRHDHFDPIVVRLHHGQVDPTDLRPGRSGADRREL